MFIDISPNIFIIKFENQVDMYQVMQRHLWQFETILFFLKPFDGYTPHFKMIFNTKVFWIHMHDLPISFMNETMAKQIGKTVGVVHECDVCDNKIGWGKYLCVLIELNLSLPITKGLTITIKGTPTGCHSPMRISPSSTSIVANSPMTHNHAKKEAQNYMMESNNLVSGLEQKEAGKALVNWNPY